MKKRVSLAAMAVVPGLVGAFGLATPAMAAVPRTPNVRPDADPACDNLINGGYYSCAFVYNSSVHVYSVRDYNWRTAGTAYIEYIEPGYGTKSKWRAHAMVHSANKLWHYSWRGIHCSFTAGTIIYGWTNYLRHEDPHFSIYGSGFTDLHNCG